MTTDSAFAYVLHAPGSLRRESRPIPPPRRGEVVVRLAATSVSFHDVIRFRGGYPQFPLPIVPFSDGCGVVMAVGEDVTRIGMGDRVIPNFFPQWSAGAIDGAKRGTVFGDQIDGTLRSHLCCDAGALVRAPDHLSDVEAATLGCAGLTAWRSVVALGNARPGDVVVVEGTGGVALFALQFAKLAGARAIVTSSSDEKLARAAAMGADATINYRRTPDWASEVLRLTEGRGADHVVDIGGPDTLPYAIQAVRIGGRVSIIGARSGLEREPVFPVRTVMTRNVTLAGLSVGSVADLEDMIKAVALHRLKPVIGETFAIEDATAALQMMEQQRHFGKIAIEIPGSAGETASIGMS